MFSLRNNSSSNSNPFRPALQYLVAATKETPTSHHQTNSSGSIDSDIDGPRSRMTSCNPKSSSEFRSTSIPLINISRSPSPYHQRQHSDSNPTSETDDDDWGDYPASQRPFLPEDGYKLTGWRALLYRGGFGQWLFTTQLGWTVYIGVLVLWLGGCQIGLTIMNRIILWSGYLANNYTSHTKLMVLIAGVYKFPYPLTTTLFEMLITHFFILLSAYITRWVSPWLTSAGVSSMIAPSKPLQSGVAPGFKGQQKNVGLLGSLIRWASGFSGGIAGGGLFEFDLAVVKQVLPLAVIFVAKVSLSNLSFAYAQLPIYMLARIGIVPLSLLFTAFLTGASHSVATLSSALTATLTLLVATSRANVRVTWESIVAGVFSSIFVALYPVQIHRTYKSLVASLVPQGELIGTFPSSNSPADYSGSREEARAYWRLLHYTSLLSIMIFLPIVFLSGEVSNISRNCYFLDVFFHWLMVLCGGLGSWAVFFSTIALTRATSPLTATFLFVPRAAFLLPIMSGFKMPSYAWIGIGMCWASCAWFLMGRRREGRPIERF
ncbi:Uncharacterized protein BP5553_04405 [Venustampulla echinocandica]|uniref:GDP-mannose transporter n=1 Tax=Venustampulla echinocandica TaxID=2656787 RepID=A0A370TN76_9HELO|nr:Uncharacterized protein BP5553_04405 [Venustampulla echinocandica]RDL36972.1 Uncharacterized protein BP5553_04405 [Venustampulla echinocandica]